MTAHLKTFVIFRETYAQDRPFLESTLAHAANNIRIDELQQDKELAALIDSWLSSENFRYIAKHTAKSLGAAYVHYWDDAKHPRPCLSAGKRSPELVIAVVKEFQNKRIGTILLHEVLEEAKKRDHSSVSVCERNTIKPISLYRLTVSLAQLKH